MRLVPDRILELVESSPGLRERYLSDAIGNPVSANASWLRNSLTAPFLGQYLGHLATLEWNEPIFDSVARDFASFLASESSVLETRTPLNNFEMDSDRLEITPTLRIERVGWEERKRFFEESRRQPYGDFNELLRTVQTEFAIYQETDIPAHFGMANDTEASETVRLLIAAMRLLRPGYVFEGMSWSRVREPSFVLGGTSRWGPWSRLYLSGAKMNLAIDGNGFGEELREMMELLTNHPSEPGLEVARRRFDFAYGRHLLEDRVIDFWIGLEALFTTEQEQSETTDKISRRIARLLGDSASSRKALLSEVKRLYQSRSILVHGKSLSAERAAEAEVRSGDLLREAIRSRLQDRWTVETIEEAMMQ